MVLERNLANSGRMPCFPCLAGLARSFDGTSYMTNLARPGNVPANRVTSNSVRAVLCVHGDDHVLDEMDVDDKFCELRICGGDPRHLSPGHDLLPQISRRKTECNGVVGDRIIR